MEEEGDVLGGMPTMVLGDLHPKCSATGSLYDLGQATLGVDFITGFLY